MFGTDDLLRPVGALAEDGYFSRGVASGFLISAPLGRRERQP
jgi:hypothetical protein